MKKFKQLVLFIIIVSCFLGCSKKRLFDLTIVSTRNVPVSTGIPLKQINERVEGKSDKDDFDMESAVESALNEYPGSVALADVVVYKKGSRLLLEGYPLYIENGNEIPKKKNNRKRETVNETSLSLGINTSVSLGINKVEVEGIYFNIISDTTVEVTRVPQEVLKEMKRNYQKIERINIPDIIEHDGGLYKVVGIEAGAFKGFSDLREIGLPNTIVYIGAEAFKNCRMLNSITFLEGLEKIGREAFSNCTALSSVYFPSSLKMIDYGAFYSCWKLKSVNIPSSTTVDRSAFSGSGVKF